MKTDPEDSGSSTPLLTQGSGTEKLLPGEGSGAPVLSSDPRPPQPWASGSQAQGLSKTFWNPQKQLFFFFF